MDIQHSTSLHLLSTPVEFSIVRTSASAVLRHSMKTSLPSSKVSSELDRLGLGRIARWYVAVESIN